jgi:hypothetical protein
VLLQLLDKASLQLQLLLLVVDQRLVALPLCVPLLLSLLQRCLLLRQHVLVLPQLLCHLLLHLLLPLHQGLLLRQ